MTETKLKMYVLIKASVPIGLGVNAVGHTSLATYLRFRDDPVLQAWVTSKHFRKVTCVVSDEQFEKAKKYPDHVVMTENALGDAEVAIGFKPREEWPEFFKSLRLFGTHLDPRKNVKRFSDDPSLTWEERFKRLSEHHNEELGHIIRTIDGT